MEFVSILLYQVPLTDCASRLKGARSMSDKKINTERKRIPDFMTNEFMVSRTFMNQKVRDVFATEFEYYIIADRIAPITNREISQKELSNNQSFHGFFS